MPSMPAGVSWIHQYGWSGPTHRQPSSSPPVTSLKFAFTGFGAVIQSINLPHNLFPSKDSDAWDLKLVLPQRLKHF